MIQDNEQLCLRQLGNGRPLLLIHGLLMNGDMFEPVLESLSKDYHVLVPDLRGFGRSGHLTPPYTVEQHARDLEKLLKSLSISSTIVLGYSQGGVVAQRKKGSNCKVALIEMKYGDGALGGSAGLVKHLKDMEKLISNKDCYFKLLETIESQFNQLDELGLLKFNKGTSNAKV